MDFRCVLLVFCCSTLFLFLCFRCPRRAMAFAFAFEGINWNGRSSALWFSSFFSIFSICFNNFGASDAKHVLRLIKKSLVNRCGIGYARIVNVSYVIFTPLIKYIGIDVAGHRSLLRPIFFSFFLSFFPRSFQLLIVNQRWIPKWCHQRHTSARTQRNTRSHTGASLWRSCICHPFQMDTTE